MSILSDVQEIIAHQPDAADLELARQYINRAKYLTYQWLKKEVAHG